MSDSAEEIDGRRPFARPSTGFNQLVERVLSQRRRHTASPYDLCRWRAASVQTLQAMGADPAVLNRVAREGEWRLVDEAAPADVWCGELRLSESGTAPPRVTFFLDSAWTRIPGRPLFELLSQIGVDHMVGHLYPYFSGADDFGENVACRYQYLMLRARGDVASWLGALTLPPGHYLHKRIPLSNYR